MKIKKVNIKNYRNLDGVEVEFHENCNFIIGENNIGKSNFLHILNIMFNSRGFSKDDFYDLSKPIEVEFALSLEEVEIGMFNDSFDPLDKTKINFVCRQNTSDDNLEFSHKETDTKINQSFFRSLNFVFYDSIRNPSHEVNFDRSRGAGKFLSNLVKRSMSNVGLDEADYINDAHIQELLSNINISVSKIKAFKDFGITAQRPSDIQGIVSRIIQLQDCNHSSFLDTGYGVQFTALITLNILDKIQQLLEKKGKFIFTDIATGKLYISLILGIDEPEIHLHPHAQRALIKYLDSIVNNQDGEFKELLKLLFGIDGVYGQIILVTHSPNIILDDYKEIIRFHRNGNSPTVISGSKITLTDQNENHFYMKQLYFKEAFFSRGVLFVEGETEQACFPKFFQKMSYDPDRLGISIISSRGGAFDTIKLLVELVKSFGIPAIGLADRDQLTGDSLDARVFITTEKDFEMELVSLIDNNKETILFDLVKALKGEDALVHSTKLQKYKNHFDKAVNWNSNVRLHEINSLGLDDRKLFYYSFFSKEKSFYTGSVIGENLPKDAIPSVCKNAILEIVNLVNPNE